jgi:single-stranded-DNA-specific exonuclease
VLKIEPYEAAVVAALEKDLKLPHLIARVLSTRGVRTAEDGRRFLYPRLDHLSDPFLLPDMAVAAETVAEPSSRAERSASSDYDADGVTSTPLMVNFLRNVGVLPEVYLPAGKRATG